MSNPESLATLRTKRLHKQFQDMAAFCMCTSEADANIALNRCEIRSGGCASNERTHEHIIDLEGHARVGKKTHTQKEKNVLTLSTEGRVNTKWRAQIAPSKNPILSTTEKIPKTTFSPKTYPKLITEVIGMPK